MLGRFCALGMSLPLGLCKQGPTPTQGMMALTPAMLDRELDNRHLGRIALAMASGDENVDPARQLLLRIQYTNMVGEREMHFKLTSNPFESVGMKGVRLRGFKIQIEAQPLDRNYTLPVVLTSPVRDTDGKPVQFSMLASNAFGDVVESEGLVKGVHNIIQLLLLMRIGYCSTR